MRCCVSDAHDAWLIQTGRRKVDRCAEVVGSGPGCTGVPKGTHAPVHPSLRLPPDVLPFTPRLPPNFHTHLKDLQLARLASQQGLHHLQHKEDGAGKMRRTKQTGGAPANAASAGGPPGGPSQPRRRRRRRCCRRHRRCCCRVRPLTGLHPYLLLPQVLLGDLGADFRGRTSRR